MATNESGRNMDELKRLVISALDKNGVLSELRASVKLHVTRAINEEPTTALVHHPSQRVAGLMATDRGQLMAELLADFLRHYDLKDTLSMLLVEAGLPKLRPSETEVANQCGFTYSSNIDLAVIEQLLARQGPPPASPHDSYLLQPISPPGGLNAADDSSGLGGTGLEGNNSPLGTGLESSLADDDSLILPINISLENDMNQMRRISAEIDRISGEKNDEPSPTYDNDFESDASPRSPTFAKQRSDRVGLLSDDNVLFESRESFKDLGETPSYMYPMDGNEHVEVVVTLYIVDKNGNISRKNFFLRLELKFRMQSIENTDIANIHGVQEGESPGGYQHEFYTSNWLKPALGPHSEDLNAKRMAFHAGPCWLKILVADRVAGSIIGKGGKVITEIETSCGCIMKLSPGMSFHVSTYTFLSVGQTFFPGTQERIVVISGTPEGISRAVRVILGKVRLFVMSEFRGGPTSELSEEVDIDISVRAVVPNSAVSCIIGRGGEVVKEINRATGAMVRIGDRMTIVHERIVQVTGTVEQCNAALFEVMSRIQSDKNLKEHLNVVYTKSAVQSNRPPPILSPTITTISSVSSSVSPVQVQTPSGPLPVNMFPDVVSPNMYSQPCSISLSLPPGTVSTTLLRSVESQTGAQLRFRQASGSVNISGTFGAVHCAHILLLKETSVSQPFTPPRLSAYVSPATPSPTAPPVRRASE